MITLTRPRAFLPLHGTLHHLLHHEALAKSLGVPSTCVLEDGEVAELRGDALVKVGTRQAGRVHIAFGRPVSADVLRERRALGQSGLAVATVRFAGDGRIEAVDIVTRGVLDEADAETIGAAADRDAKTAVLALTDAERANPALLTDAVRLAVRRALTRATGSKPEVVVVRLR